LASLTLKLPSWFSEQQLAALSPEEKGELYDLLRTREALIAHKKLLKYYPDSGSLRRELYPKHLVFFRAGRERRENCFLAANRVGTTEGVGGFECSLHLTGRYPEWWEGRRFDHSVSAWAVGDTSKTKRDVIQQKLLGPPGDFGTGLIPGEALIGTTPKPGVPDAVGTIYVRHMSGRRSDITLKSYDQGRASSQGTNKHIVWLDEECGIELYIECLICTMPTDGIIIATFTPLLGMSKTVKYFLGIEAKES
jgi:phage terminase large subunit-like protein